MGVAVRERERESTLAHLHTLHTSVIRLMSKSFIFNFFLKTSQISVRGSCPPVYPQMGAPVEEAAVGTRHHHHRPVTALRSIRYNSEVQRRPHQSQNTPVFFWLGAWQLRREVGSLVRVEPLSHSYVPTLWLCCVCCLSLAFTSLPHKFVNSYSFVFPPH